MVKLTGEDAATLAAVLTADLARVAEQSKRLEEALIELNTAVHEGRLEAWGHRCDGHGHPIGDGENELIQPSFFHSKTERRTVLASSEVVPPPGPDGNMTLAELFEPTGPRYKGVTFSASEVQTIWPEILPPVEVWMLAYATDFFAKNGRPPARDTEAVVDANGAGFGVDPARAAYANLPAHLKNPDRKPKRAKFAIARGGGTR